MKKLTLVTIALLMILMMGFPGNVSAGTCSVLNIYFDGILKDGWSLLGCHCSKGNIRNVTTTYVMTVQSPIYGPECKIEFQKGDYKALYRVQQNYCFLEAGNITVQFIGTGDTKNPDALRYTITPGSYGDDREGKVSFFVK